MRSHAALVGLALAGSCTASHSLGDDAASAPTCSGHYASVIPDVDRSCSSDADCAIGAHFTTCCGDTWAMGIARSARASFDAAEAACRAGLYRCGCMGFMLTTDDHTQFMEGGAPVGAAVVACLDGICATRLRPSVACGSTTCRPSQACVTGCAGDGGMPAPHCVPIPSDCAASDDCGCFGAWGLAPCSPGTCSAIRDGTPSCSCP